MKLSKAQAEARYKRGMAELVARYGASNIPSDEQRALSEALRAFFVIEAHAGQVTARILSQYMIPASVAQQVMDEMGIDANAPQIEHKASRKERVANLIKFAKANHGKEFTTEELVEVAGFCHATTLKFLNDTPYFKKIKRGLYEAIDVASERAQARKTA